MENIGQKRSPVKRKFSRQKLFRKMHLKNVVIPYIFFFSCTVFFSCLKFSISVFTYIFEFVTSNLINLNTQLRSKQKQVKLCIIIKYHQFKILSTCVDARSVVTGILTFNFPFFVVLETIQKN